MTALPPPPKTEKFPASLTALRDEFAMAALPAMLEEKFKTDHWNNGWRAEVAQEAYAIADAMMACRKEYLTP